MLPVFCCCCKWYQLRKMQEIQSERTNFAAIPLRFLAVKCTFFLFLEALGKLFLCMRKSETLKKVKGGFFLFWHVHPNFFFCPQYLSVLPQIFRGLMSLVMKKWHRLRILWAIEYNVPLCGENRVLRTLNYIIHNSITSLLGLIKSYLHLNRRTLQQYDVEDLASSGNHKLWKVVNLEWIRVNEFLKLRVERCWWRDCVSIMLAVDTTKQISSEALSCVVCPQCGENKTMNLQITRFYSTANSSPFTSLSVVCVRTT